MRKVWKSPHASPAERIFYYKLLANKEEKEAIYDTSIRAQAGAPKHEITLNLIKDEEEKAAGVGLPRLSFKKQEGE